MSNEVSQRHDRTFVARTHAAEKARFASIDVAGMVSKYAYTCSRQRPLVSLFLKTASSALMEFTAYLQKRVLYLMTSHSRSSGPVGLVGVVT